MGKHSFNEGKTVAKVEWRLSDCCAYPDLLWARPRVFSDGSADAAFFGESLVYEFDREEYASYFLSEDEYIPVDSMDEGDGASIGVKRADLTPPDWPDDADAEFKYLGTY